MALNIKQRRLASISAYTGNLLCEFDWFHQYVEEIMERPVWTHEFANEKIRLEIQKLSEEDFKEAINYLIEEAKNA